MEGAAEVRKAWSGKMKPCLLGNLTVFADAAEMASAIWINAWNVSETT